MIETVSVDTGDDEASDVLFTGVVPVLGERTGRVRPPGPALGQHTAEVLDSVGKHTDHA